MRTQLARGSRPLAPRWAQITPKLTTLADIRAIVFDIYGTLFVSASGDIGTRDGDSRQRAVGNALSSAGYVLAPPFSDRDWFAEVVTDHHRVAKDAGIEFPEVDVREVWRDLLQRGREAGSILSGPNDPDLTRLAVDYELRANPVWPMPDLVATLDGLRDRGLRLGLASNAQLFTPELFPALAGREAEALGFEPQLSVLSYQLGHAKPGDAFYAVLSERLRAEGIQPHQALMVGNDMLNDIRGAARAGLKTALFAGCARSLRTRNGDERVAGIVPDVIVTSLSELETCLPSPRAEG